MFQQDASVETIKITQTHHFFVQKIFECAQGNSKQMSLVKEKLPLTFPVIEKLVFTVPL